MDYSNQSIPDSNNTALQQYIALIWLIEEEMIEKKYFASIILNTIKNNPSLVTQPPSFPIKNNLLHILSLCEVEPCEIFNKIFLQIPPEMMPTLLNQKNHESKTPFELAKAQGNQRFAEILRRLTVPIQPAKKSPTRQFFENAATRFKHVTCTFKSHYMVFK